MEDVVICTPLRTPVGRYGGVLREQTPQAMAATVIQALVARSGVDPDDVDDVVLGQGYSSGEGPALGRVAALDAGLPVGVPGMQVDRRCGSGLWAVLQAAMQVQTGGSRVVLAGGAESMSQVEYYSSGFRFGRPPAKLALVDRLVRGRETAGGEHYPVPGGMLETAENLRREYGVSRSEQDELAARSHARAVAAQQSGAFDEEIVPLEVRERGKAATVAVDEHPRADTDVERLSTLKPVRIGVDPEATVTAGNASGQNDGAAICIVTSRQRAHELGLQPVLRLVSWGLAGVEPARMGIGPVPASDLALGRAGLKLADMDLVEVNEAFAAQVLAVTRAWGFGESDFDRLNVNGSGISLGHPVGATGARILATMAYELRRRQSRYALETMCIGGGQGLAAVFERAA